MKLKIYPKRNFLNRFTTLPVLLDMLLHKRITLLEPDTWEDKNDAYYLRKYKEANGLETVLACCFTTKRETFHHWKIFAGGLGGVCVEFNKDRLLESARALDGIRMGKVRYLLIKENKEPKLPTWPFLKRLPFKDEEEFRIIYQNRNLREKTKDIEIDLGCIRKITLSPWMPNSLRKSIAKVIKSIDEECSELDIRKSTLIESVDWQKCISRDEGIRIEVDT